MEIKLSKKQLTIVHKAVNTYHKCSKALEYGLNQDAINKVAINQARNCVALLVQLESTTNGKITLENNIKTTLENAIQNHIFKYELDLKCNKGNPNSLYNSILQSELDITKNILAIIGGD